MQKINSINDFAKWLSKELYDKEWSDTYFAGKSDVSVNSISRITRGGNPGLEIMLLILKGLGKHIEIWDDEEGG